MHFWVGGERLTNIGAWSCMMTGAWNMMVERRQDGP